MKRVFVLFLVGLFCIGAMGMSAEADPVDKLGRGTVNVLTGWLEVPKTIYEDSVAHNPIFGGTFGLLHGVAGAIYRAGAGLIDIVTAPFPPYDVHIVPEYVF